MVGQRELALYTLLAEAANPTQAPLDRIKSNVKLAQIFRTEGIPKLVEVAVWGLIAIGRDQTLGDAIRLNAYLRAYSFALSNSEALKIAYREHGKLLKPPRPDQVGSQQPMGGTAVINFKGPTGP